MDFIDITSPFYDPTVQFGDNSANRIAPIGGFGDFNRAVFSMGGSGAIDNVQVIPEPGTLAVWTLLSGIAGCWWRRSKKRSLVLA